METLWNERYAGTEFIYGRKPNAFLKTFLEKENPGIILFPSEGEGRNAIYAAIKGWQVIAVDYSEVARHKALNWATENGVTIDYQTADLTEWENKQTFNAIALIYAHYPKETRESIHRKFVNSLRPGGKIVLEAFSNDQIHNTSGGPREISMLYDTTTLINDFSKLKILYLQEQNVTLDEGIYHRGEASVIRMIAEKQ